MGLAWFSIHVGFITYDGLTDENQKAVYAVVLGSKVETTGKVSLRLQTRLDKAVDLYHQQKVDTLIVSGGLGVEGFEEADVMKAYLEAKQIPSKLILVDRDGYTTYRTAQNVKKMIQNVEQKVIVVSHYFHISRTKLAFQKFGFTNVTGAHSNIYLEPKEPYSLFREFLGYYYYWWRSYPSELIERKV